MHLPDHVEPFVETEPERLGVTIAVLATLAVAVLWETSKWIAGYPIALAIGAASAFAAMQLRRDRFVPDTAALHRLPVFLRFDDRRVVVVGGGRVAAAKLPALIAAGARVTVIAPSVVPEIARHGVEIIQRQFEAADLDGAWFVTAAATPEVNRTVRAAADIRGVFVNAVDDPANATAYLGGTIARGGVTVAISTAGKAPALAGLLREALDALLPEDLDRWAARAHELSRRQRRDGVAIESRRPQLLTALNALYESRTPGRS